MALESNSWLSNTPGNTPNREHQHPGMVKNREEQLGQHTQTFGSQGQHCGLLKIPSSVGKCSMFTQTEHTNRFTQTEHPSSFFSNGNCLEASNNIVNCETATMFHPLNVQQQTNTPQIYGGAAEKNAEMEKNSKAASEYMFCYNVNVLQKVHQQQTATVVPVGAIGGGNIGQPLSYNYTLVNQVSLAAAASTATFKCDICGLVFSHLSLLNHHKRIHGTTTGMINTGTQSTTERQYSCDICGAIFNQPDELNVHKTGMHGKTSPNTEQQSSKCCDTCGVEVGCEHRSGGTVKGKKNMRTVKCGSCQDMNSGENSAEPGVSFSGGDTSGDEGASNLIVSSSTNTKPGYHAVKRRGVASVIQCPKCNGSGIIFVGGPRNKTGADKPFHCNICDGRFSRYSSLWSHKRLHSGEKPYKCEVCGLAFARSAYLRNHVRVHTGEKPYSCNVCGMQFSQSPHLKNHERIHSGERPYQCEVCEKTFARHSTLWNHRRIHTGEKPYRCEICDSAFSQATHLNNHAKVHTGEKSHRCDICDVGFSDRFSLKRHRGIHEKYGRTSATSSVCSTQEDNQDGAGSSTDNNVNTNSTTTSPNANPPQTGMDELYKCDVGGTIAFPGCSHPHDQKQ